MSEDQAAVSAERSFEPAMLFGILATLIGGVGGWVIPNMLLPYYGPLVGVVLPLFGIPVSYFALHWMAGREVFPDD